MPIKKKVTTTPTLKEAVEKVVTKKKTVKGVPDVVEVVKPTKDVISEGVVTLEAQRRIGMSKGMTVNMGDYQSARIDIWMEKLVPDNEREVEKGIAELSKCIDEHLTDEVNELKA